MRKGRPFLLGIAGDSGSGKATFARGLVDLLGPQETLVLSLDDYHSLDREARRRLGITPLDPRANRMSLMEEHARRLRAGEPVVKPVYDHSTGTFGTPVLVRPRRVVVMTGLLPFFREGMRSLFDLRVFLDPHEGLKVQWKVGRDLARRGYTFEQLQAELAPRRADFRRFVLPQKFAADLWIRFFLGLDPLREQAELRALVAVNGGGLPPLLLARLGAVEGVELHRREAPLLMEVGERVQGPGLEGLLEEVGERRRALGLGGDGWRGGSGPVTALRFCQALAAWLVLTRMEEVRG